MPSDYEDVGKSGGRVREHRTGAPRCGACGGAVGDDDPALYEMMVDGTIAAVVLPEDEPFEVPPGAALVDIFHPSCFRELVEDWSKRGRGPWSGHCPLSGQTIVAQHPIEACPVCGGRIVAGSRHDASA